MTAVALGSRHHGLALRQRDRHGLLHQHVLPGVQSRRADLRMAAVLHTYRYGVYVGIIHQLVEAVVDLAAILRRHLLGTRRVLVVESYDLRIGVGCILRQMAHLCDLAAADNADSDHKKANLLCPFLHCRPRRAAAPRICIWVLYQKKRGKKRVFCKLCKNFHKICAATVSAQPFFSV